jgi:hypothetical protein
MITGGRPTLRIMRTTALADGTAHDADQLAATVPRTEMTSSPSSEGQTPISSSDTPGNMSCANSAADRGHPSI